MYFNREKVQPPAGVVLPEYVPKGSELASILFESERAKGAEAKIFNYIDPDIDGLTAGLIVEQYIEKLGLINKHYKYYINQNRAHGFKLTDEQLKLLKGYLLIVTDFTVERNDVLRILKAGINLIVIDHHEIDKDSYWKTNEDFLYLTYNGDGFKTGAVIINNQYSGEPDEFRFLSGAGMVYYFLKCLEKKYNVFMYNDTPAQVGITLLSDVRDIDNLYARQFLKYTYTVDSPYMKYLQWLASGEKKSNQRFSAFGVPLMTRDFIDFTFSPVINSLLRANLGQDALSLLRGRDDKKINEYRENDRILVYRNIQKAVINATVEEHKRLTNVPNSLNKSFSNMKVCCLSSDFQVKGYPNVNISNYIGVACSRIKGDDNTGVILVVDNTTNKIIRGSVRGGIEGVDYLEIFKSNNIPSAGHHNAFGILECDISQIDFEKLNTSIAEAEQKFLEENIGNTRSVIDANHLGIFLKGHYIQLICKYNEYSRDNNRIYLRYTGNVEDEKRVKSEKVSDKFIRYFIDGVCVNCYDPSIDIQDALILIGMDNNKYVRCTLRPSFDYSHQSNDVILEKLSSIASL